MGLALINILFPLPSPLPLSLRLLKSSSLSSWFLCPSLTTWPTWGGSYPLDCCVRAAAHGVGLQFWHLHNHWGSSQVGNMVGAFLPLSLVRAVIFGLVILVPYLVICLCYIHIVCKLRNSRQHVAHCSAIFLCYLDGEILTWQHQHGSFLDTWYLSFFNNNAFSQTNV